MSTSDRIAISAVAVRRLTEVGIDCALLLRRAGLSPSLLTEREARLSTAGFFQLWQTLGEMAADPLLGVRIGSEVSAGQFDVASTAAIHAASLRDALGMMARYKRLVCPEEIRLRDDEREASVEFRWVLARVAPPPMLIDCCFAAALLLARYGCGAGVAPLRVDYARAPAHAEQLAAHFGCPVNFDAQVDRIVFDAALLDLPFASHNPDLIAVLLPGLDASVQAQDQAAVLATPDPSGFMAQVAATVKRQMQGHRPSVNEVARALALSPRTLQRRLAEHGSSYQALLDAVREQTARALLTATSIDPGEIAFLLGFEELNSFVRAFRGWSGTTPQRWRQQAPGQMVQ